MPKTKKVRKPRKSVMDNEPITMIVGGQPVQLAIDQEGKSYRIERLSRKTNTQSIGTRRPTMTLLRELRAKIVSGKHPTVYEFQQAVEQTSQFLASSIVSGDLERIGQLSTALIQTDAIYFDLIGKEEKTPDEWARALAVVGKIATYLYELLEPSFEVRKILSHSNKKQV